MNSNSSQTEQRCFRCQSSRLIQGHGEDMGSLDFALNSEDRQKGFWAYWRFKSGSLNMGPDRTLCLDCGLVTGFVDIAKAETMLRRDASDELLLRVGLARE